MPIFPSHHCILLIDDEPDLCQIVKLTLEHLKGWKVIAVESGRLGLAQALANQPDAILLDLSLPDGDGLMLLQALKTNPATQSIPVILLTAKEIDENSLEFNSCKVAGVILKPFNVLELSDRIAVLLGW